MHLWLWMFHIHTYSVIFQGAFDSYLHRQSIPLLKVHMELWVHACLIAKWTNFHTGLIICCLLHNKSLNTCCYCIPTSCFLVPINFMPWGKFQIKHLAYLLFQWLLFKRGQSKGHLKTKRERLSTAESCLPESQRLGR